MAGLDAIDEFESPWFSRALAGVLALVAIATVASLIPGPQWWLRIFDFVLEVLLYVCLIGGVLALWADRWRWKLIAGFTLFGSMLLALIWPYVVVAPNEIDLGKPEGAECFSLLTLNVLQENDQYDRTLDLIRERDPDMLLLTETNQVWLDRLMPVLERYPQRMAEPLDNTYGMIFATRLPVQRAQMPMDRIADLPTLYATVTIPNAGDFELIGLHPRPPKPGEDVETRNQNIIEAGAKTPDGLEEALAIGDFNDVPWSKTTEQFREMGNYGDPRAGRGTYPTFPSWAGKFGWPLDHIFVKGGLHVRNFAVLDDVGSDHRPLAADICMVPESSN